MKTTLLIPTINEIDGLRVTMPQINPEWVDEILIVDGGSTDGTVEYLTENGYRVLQQTKTGLPNAYREGVDVSQGDVIITFTPDGNSLPEKIPELVEKMKEEYDMVIVSRYKDDAKSEDDDFITAFGNRLFTTMINVLFNAKYTDALVGFRAWKRELLDLPSYEEIAGGTEPHLSVVAAKYGLKTMDLSGDEPKRIGGIRKMNPIRNGLGILKLIFVEYFMKNTNIAKISDSKGHEYQDNSLK